MTMTAIREALLWCVLINYALLLIWAGMFIFAHNWMYRLHARWFQLSVATFDAINLGGIIAYKLGIFLLNLVPLLALYLSA